MARTAQVDTATELLDAVAKGNPAAVDAILRTEAGRAAADAVCGDPETTPLLVAVKGEHTSIVSLLLDASADPDRVPSAESNGEPPGDSPLQHAAAEGFLDIVHLLLSAKADVNACASLPDDDDAFYDQPPLSFACENAHPDVVGALLANKADVNRRSTENRSPLELAAGSENAADEALVEVVAKLVGAGASLESVDEEETPLIRAATAGHVLVTRELLEAGADPNWSRTSNGETALYVACSEGHAAVVEELAQHGGSVNARKTTTSETALYIACSKGHLEVVKALLKSGVQTDDEQNTVPRTGYYPLYIAASNGHAEVVEDLYQAGCSIATLTSNKDTPLIIAAYNGYAKVIEVLAVANADVHYTKSGSGETALYYACLQGRLAAVKALIAANARHSDALFDNQETPLHCAAMGGHAQVVTELLKAGAKHDATKSDGATPLYSACHGGKLEAHDGQLQSVKELLRAGGDPNACRPMDQGGDSCLIIAAFHQRSRMVEELLKAGADVEYANTDGMCALGWAVKKNVTPMVRALIEHGADPEFYNTAATSTPLIKAAMTTVTEGETKAQQQAQDIVSILLDAGASLSQSVAVARKHVPKAVKALQVVKMRRRRDAKTKGEAQSASRTAEQLEEAELRAQQAMQELLAEENMAQVKATSKKGKRKQNQTQQSSAPKKTDKSGKTKVKMDSRTERSPNEESLAAQDTARAFKIPKEWAGLLEDADASVDAELSLLGTPVSAASEVGVDSVATAATESGLKSTDHHENYVFFCTDGTEEETLRRELSGDSEAMLPVVREIGASTRLYLFNSSSGRLYGAFQCVDEPGNLAVEALPVRGKQAAGKKSQFTAQIRFSQNNPVLGRTGVRVPKRLCPKASGPVDDVSVQSILVTASAAAGRVYPPIPTRGVNVQAVDMPALVLPTVEVFRRRALESTVQAMVLLFDGMCPERWQRMKPFTKRRFCQDLQHKWIFREAAWNNAIPLQTSRPTTDGAPATDALLPSATAVEHGKLRSYIVQQLRAEPYHMAEEHVEGALATLMDLFSRASQRVAQFSKKCVQLLQQSRGTVALQRRGRSRNAAWTDAIFGVTLSKDRKSTRNAANGKASVRLQWSDTQFPELGHETVELWEDNYQRLVDLHTQNGLEPELAKARIFAMTFRHETLAEQKVGVPLALPLAASTAMKLQFGVQHECFASPWNATTGTFCSLFADTDSFFGSRGNFFDYRPTVGSFLVHPPPDMQTMQDACNHVVRLLSESVRSLSFCLVVSADLLVPITDLIEPEHAILVRHCTVLPRGKHCFLAGMQHRQVGKSDELTRITMEKGDSHLYWLQNDAGSREFCVTVEAAAILVDSFKSQPTFGHGGMDTGTATPEPPGAQRSSGVDDTDTEPGLAVSGAHGGDVPADETASTDAAVSVSLIRDSDSGLKEPSKSSGADLAEITTLPSEVALAPLVVDMANTGSGRSLEDTMKHLGGKPLTIGDTSDDAETPSDEFAPDRQLLAWLDALGLAKYSPLFVQAEVDLAALCLLTNQDLLDIGVVPLGARKKLLRATGLLPPEAASLFACVSL